ncbi:MAG: SDR family oxidoreductase [Chloroflexi bacterium]|nr:SDR family oxidoreductase [Chloroflexota bacterium]
MDSNGKVALVTGAGRRVGRALALALGDAGCRVAVHYSQSEKDAQETASLINSLAPGSEAVIIQADLEDPEQVESLASSVAEQLGPIEILVNNAAVFEQTGLKDVSVDDWDRHFAINVRAPFLLAQSMRAQLSPDAAGQGTPAQSAPGKIISLNDWRTARPGRFAYGVTKSALSGLTRTLALALAPHIQVNEVALGAILPPANIALDRPREEIKIDLGPADRMGTLNEVANAVLMLVHNDFITGETINVDGGMHIY